MTKKPTKPQPTKYSIALSAAIEKAGATQAAIARHMGVSDGAVNQWTNGRRPVPADKAARLAAYLKIDATSISEAYGTVMAAQDSNVVPLRQAKEEDGLRPDLVIRRLENDVDAMRHALGALAAATVVHRPAEAREVAKAIRKAVPEKFVERGFLKELLAMLDKSLHGAE